MKKDREILDELSENLDGLVLCTFRYYLGRKTIQAAMFAESLSKIFPKLKKDTQRIIRRDLERAFEDDERCESFSPLGQDCDKKAWKKVLRACLESVRKDERSQGQNSQY